VPSLCFVFTSGVPGCKNCGLITGGFGVTYLAVGDVLAVFLW
jgi:hypothetical protein